MDNEKQNAIQSVYVTVHGLDSKLVEMHLDRNTIRTDGERLYYDDNKNVLLVKDEDGTLHMQLILAKTK